jgi:hypothetical protein
LPFNRKAKIVGMIKDIFGPFQSEIWGELAKKVDGRFQDGGWFGTSAVLVSVSDWKIMLDTYVVSNGKSSTTYTRMRAPIYNRDNFVFKIQREGILADITKFFGAQDIMVGDKYFDDNFIIKSNDERKAIELLSDQRLQSLIHKQPQICFEIVDKDGWFNDAPKDVDILNFSRVGLMKNITELENLFELFSRTLSCLAAKDSSFEKNPKYRVTEGGS